MSSNVSELGTLESISREICRKVPEKERFTPDTLMEVVPNLKGVIDLTDTNRYYDPADFTSKGVDYKKINIQGQGKLPPSSKLYSFYRIVDQFVEKHADDPDALLGVHCTHGLNRTGYMICKYMVEKMKIDPVEAISKFESARGYPIERKVFTDNVCGVTTRQERGSMPHRNMNHHRNADRNNPRRGDIPARNDHLNYNWRSRQDPADFVPVYNTGNSYVNHSYRNESNLGNPVPNNFANRSSYRNRDLAAPYPSNSESYNISYGNRNYSPGFREYNRTPYSYGNQNSSQYQSPLESSYGEQNAAKTYSDRPKYRFNRNYDNRQF